MKMTPPWSRRRLTQPHSETVWPSSSSVTRPQYSDLIDMMFVFRFALVERRAAIKPCAPALQRRLDCRAAHYRRRRRGRRHDAHRDDVLERGVDRHVEF